MLDDGVSISTYLLQLIVSSNDDSEIGTRSINPTKIEPESPIDPNTPTSSEEVVDPASDPEVNKAENLLEDSQLNDFDFLEWVEKQQSK